MATETCEGFVSIFDQHGFLGLVECGFVAKPDEQGEGGGKIECSTCRDRLDGYVCERCEEEWKEEPYGWIEGWFRNNWMQGTCAECASIIERDRHRYGTWEREQELIEAERWED